VALKKVSLVSPLNDTDNISLSDMDENIMNYPSLAEKYNKLVEKQVNGYSHS
jgi:hypothetical protein